MTEEDTFRLLSRITFAELRLLIYNTYKIVDSVAFLTEHKWTLDEYFGAYYDHHVACYNDSLSKDEWIANETKAYRYDTT